MSLQPGEGQGSRRAGIVTGLVAGTGFALLFIALDRAGTSAGAWPLLPGQAVATLTVVAWAALARNRPARTTWSQAWRIGVAAGVLGGIANCSTLPPRAPGSLP